MAAEDADLKISNKHLGEYLPGSFPQFKAKLFPFDGSARKGKPRSLDPETAWLLKFVNLGRRPGKLTPSYPSMRLMWSPKELKAPILSDQPFHDFDDGSKYFWDNGNGWVITEEGDTIFMGKIITFSLEEFWRFISEEKHSPVGAVDDRLKKIIRIRMDAIVNLWFAIRHCFLRKMIDNAETFVGNHIETTGFKAPAVHVMDTNDHRPFFFPLPESLYSGIYAYFCNLYWYHRDLYDHMKLCPICGRFFLPEKERQKYCETGGKCFKLAKRQSREDHAADMRLIRSLETEERRRLDSDRIRQDSIREGLTPEEAEREASDATKRGRSYDQWKREH